MRWIRPISTQDRIPYEEFAELIVTREEEPHAYFECVNCGDDVHHWTAGTYNEALKNWVRFGTEFVCAECIADAFDLPSPRSKWPKPEEIDAPDWLREY